MTESWRNQELRNIYLRAWPDLAHLLVQDPELSSPYLAWVHPDYEAANIRHETVWEA